MKFNKVLRYNHETGRTEEFDKEKVPVSGDQIFLGAKGWATGCVSEGAGCHSSQVDQFRQDAREAGITGVDFTAEGKAVFSCRSARRDYMKLRGMFDRDAGYGDAAPNYCEG